MVCGRIRAWPWLCGVLLSFTVSSGSSHLSSSTCSSVLDGCRGCSILPYSTKPTHLSSYHALLATASTDGVSSELS